MYRQGTDPSNPEHDSWDPAFELGLDIDVDDGCLNFGSTDGVAPREAKKTAVFFKIVSKNMSRHLLHKDLQVGNSDAIAQVYDVLQTSPDYGNDSTVSITQATGKLAVISLCLWCQAFCFCLQEWRCSKF